MTSPLAPQPTITQEPGLGDRIGAAIAPFLEALKERREREQRQQQLMTQLGHLKVQEEELADRKRQENERAKGFKEMGAGLMQEIGKLREPGPLQQEISGAMQSGDPQLMEAVMTRIRRAGGIERVTQVRQQYAEQAKQSGGRLAPEQQLAMFEDMLAADPDSPNAGTLGTVINTLRVGQRPKTMRTKVESVERGGKTMRVLINMDTGAEIAEVGDAPETYYDFLTKYGRNSQESAARAAVRFGNAIGKIEKLAGDQSVVDETAEALTLIEGAGRFPWQLGDLAGFSTRLYQQGKISAGAQIMLRNFYDVLAAEGFGEGGKQLTKAEWDIATRAFMPLMGEAPEAFAEKMQAANTRFKTHWTQGGPASERLLDLLDPAMRARIGRGSAENKPVTGSTEDKLRRTRGLGR